MIKTQFITALLLLGAHFSFAQNEVDALNLSREEVTGSARFIALGGAFTSLGGDFSGSAINPAGVAVFRNSEFSLTPAYHTHISSSDYYGTSTIGSKTNFNFGSLGLVAVRNLTKTGKWKSSAFSVGINRTFNYNQSTTIQGSGIPTSILDDYENILRENNVTWTEFSSDYPAYPFDLFLAWNNYLIDTTSGGVEFFNASGQLPNDQTRLSEITGSKRETVFNFGSNYDDKWYFGIGLIFSRNSRTFQYAYRETYDDADTTTSLSQFTYEFAEKINGNGTAMNIGAIYRPIEPLRIGFSFKSPTFYSLDIEYSSRNDAVFGDTSLSTNSPQTGFYEFRLTTPMQANLGVSYVFQKHGLLTADIEFVDYTGIRMFGISDGYSFSKEESNIKTYLTPQINTKLGGEYRLTSNFSLRGGFAHYGDPFNKKSLGTDAFNLYSFGLGYRTDLFYLDGSYQMKTSADSDFIYDASLVDAYAVERTDHRFAVTFGFKF